MVKTPKTRHSRVRREPATLDLQAGDVTRLPSESVSGSEPEALEDRRDGGGEVPDHEAAVDSAEAPGDAGTEAGTVSQADQDYRPAESVPPTDDYGFRDDMAPAKSEAAKAQQAATGPAWTPPMAGTAPRRGDGIGRIASGVVGAVVALLLAVLLQYAGVFPGMAPAGDSTADIATLRQEVETLKTAPPPSNSVDLEALKAEIASLREQVAAAGQGDSADLRQRLDALDSRVAGLGNGGDTGEAMAALGERVAAAEALVKTTAEKADASDGRLAALDQSLTEIKGRVDAQAAQPKIALAIATAALKSAVDRGAPFAAELETFAAIMPGAEGLDTLRARAVDGVATRDQLLAEFEPAASAMLAAANPVDPDAGYFDRLLNSAESLVSVRPVGEVAGDTAAAVLARVEVALRAGDLARATSEFDTLPDPVKSAGAAFGQRLKARAEVEGLVDRTIAAAMKA